MRLLVLIILVLIYTPPSILAQRSEDTLKKQHSPNLAASLSAIVPGLGQAYNKKYWKIPIIYAGMGTFAYLTYRNHKYYKDFKNAYKELANTNPNGYYYMYNTTFTLSGLDAGKNFYRRYRDMYAIFTVGVYLLNIIDATVDAYFFDFDVSDNLALTMQPSFIIYTENTFLTPGIKICINSKK